MPQYQLTPLEKMDAAQNTINILAEAVKGLLKRAEDAEEALRTAERNVLYRKIDAQRMKEKYEPVAH
jgi:hypothetical protein